MIKLSIIIPVYNVEKYIERCIRSLYDQNIPQEEYEVICVDDCSPDGSRVIVERLQTEFPTLQLIVHENNKRQGGARNTGLQKAKGEYIWFVDSDDYILPNVLGCLYQEAKDSDLDIIHFNFEQSKEGEETIYTTKLPRSNKVYSGCEFAVDPYYDKSINFSLCWLEWIRKELLISYNIQFAEYMQFEDVDFAYRIYARANRVMQSNIMAYHYIVREGSTMSSKYNAIKMRDHIMTIVRSEQMLPTIDNELFKQMVLRYIYCEISQAGMRIKSLPLKEKMKYVRLINRQAINTVRHRTSFRNWLRIRYGLPV